MVQLSDGLRWILTKRFGCAPENISTTQIGPVDTIGLALVDTETWLHVAVVVDVIRIRSVQSLALMAFEAAMPHLARTMARDIDAKKRTVIKLVVVFRNKCTLRNIAKETTQSISVDDNVQVDCCLFNEQQITNHPLQYSIVPQDYRVVDPTSEEMAELRKKANPIERLPRMNTSDAVAHLLGYEIGQVIAHTSCMGGMPPTTKYRLVVKPESS